ncbi:MAG: aminoacyl-tRNA hydrolase [Puniceicoccales bacterium]|jgi:PTH1 family peptidyl-tRNA hydrolase|nr:aminoacyl-tRNA hydrolase [Puniceicoccales bacterium]
MDTPAVIAGLGNPGPEYADTRHNTGFRILDALATRAGATFTSQFRANGAVAKTTLASRPVWLVKPLTYMNDSGRCVGPYAQFLKIPPENVLVVYDDITLATGTVKLTTGGSDGGHNGITSLLQHLPNTFARFRVGIGGKHWPGQNLADHVLGKLTFEEQKIITEKLTFYIQGIEIWLTQGLAIAQNLINKKTTPTQ